MWKTTVLLYLDITLYVYLKVFFTISFGYKFVSYYKVALIGPGVESQVNMIN